MSQAVCPNCGYKQDGGPKCEKCSTLFEYYQNSSPHDLGAIHQSHGVAGPAYDEAPRTGPSLFRRIYRIVSWASLALLILAIFLIFHKSPAPQVPVDPQAAQRAESKLEASESAAASGQPQPLRLDKTEVNSYLHQNLALQPSDTIAPAVPATPAPASPTPVPAPSTPAPAAPDPTVEQVQSSVKDVQVTMHDDKVEAYVVFNFHGQDLSLNLEGRLNVANGYLQFEPTGGKLGSLPIPQSTLESAVQQMLNSPENREKLKMPANISNLRIENGQLVVDYK